METIFKPKNPESIQKDFLSLSLHLKYRALKTVKDKETLIKYMPYLCTRIFKGNVYKIGEFWCLDEFLDKHIVLKNTFNNKKRKIRYKNFFNNFSPVYKEYIMHKLSIYNKINDIKKRLITILDNYF